jgi:D-erythro-7,8-dihydroneopterin triphosphate epimerase
MAEITIKNLLLRTEVGFNNHELGKKQDLILNVSLEFDTQGEEVTDDPAMAIDYRSICKKIIEVVENNRFNLVEAVAQRVLDVVLANPRVYKAGVEVDKPHALRFAESVSVKLTQGNR